MTQPQHAGPPADGYRTFLKIWLGQLVSTIGSGLTGFVLGVWVLQETGSTTQFALIAAATSIPGILMLPFAGAVVDRFDRRKVMLFADVVAALCTLTLALLFARGTLEVWHIWITSAISSAASSFQHPAYSSIIPLLVPRERLGKVNGLVQTGQSLAIFSPVIAGALIGIVGVPGVIAIDLATFAFAAGMLLLVRVPRPVASAAGAQAKGSIWREAAYGWTYLRARGPLLWLVGLFGLYNFFVAMVSVLILPLILSFTSVQVASVLYAAGGCGMVAGGLVMSSWGGPKRKIDGVLGFMALGGLFLFLHGLAPSPWLIAAMAPAFLSTVPVISASATAILQMRVPGDVLGRVFATVGMLSRMSAPVAYFLAGPLADRVFGPMMRPGGALAGSLGAWIGTGQGRGIAVIFMICGVALAAASLAGWLNPHLRRVEDPEAEPLAAPAPAEAEAVPA
ncbi:MAG TPA: MFS transporter [Longimicrobium sp.]|nr:MFS transporter [Longimicrobium sp.]